MTDRPSSRELLSAVERFLDEDLVPDLKGRRQFLARVAANALRLVAREMGDELSASAAPDPELLRQQIRAGDYANPDDRKRLLAILRSDVRGKLSVSNPRGLAADEERDPAELGDPRRVDKIR
jgi:hypothetical protein